MTTEEIELDMEFTADKKKARWLAVNLWNECYQRGKANDAEAMGMLRQYLHDCGGPIEVNRLTGERQKAAPNEAYDFSLEADCSFLAVWADNAFATLETSHKYAAALMCTTAARDVVEDITLPWKAFSVTLPTGMLRRVDARYDCGFREFAEIRVGFFPYWESPTRCVYFAYMRMIDTELGCMRVTAADMAALLFEDAPDVEDNRYFRDMEDIDRRILLLGKRLVVGLLIAYQHTNNFRDRVYGDHGVVDPRDGKPEHRVVFFGAPIVLDGVRDMRDSIKGFVTGDRPAVPSVQVLVRGHYKRQVIGVGRAGRKVIWVEPYWRGPEDAPILSRPYKIGPV